MNRNRLRREFLFKKDPHCHWCGVLLITFEVPMNIEKGNFFPSNFATLDHLYDKFEPDKRQEFWRNKKSQTVLACITCNRKRNNERMKVIGGTEGYKIRVKLGQERKKILSKQPRPQLFRGLQNI